VESNAKPAFPAFIEAMRPSHWIKNIFVVAPLLFSGSFRNAQDCCMCAFAFAVFCLLSSAIYIFNDICDSRTDRLHPVKSARPIASGRLSIGAARVLSILCAAAGIGICYLYYGVFGNTDLLLVLAFAYLLMNIFYSMGLKQVPMLDVIIVSAGFVIRAMAGAAAIGVASSPWLVLCTFSLCLYLAVTKRRVDLRKGAIYKKEELQRMGLISAGLAVITYSLYCLAPMTVARIGSPHLVWTVPLVIYGIFRYERVSRRSESGDVVTVLIRDRVMWYVLLVYAIVVTAVMRWGAEPFADGILLMNRGQ
jgi:4-hydroxybenzoate polyprenyltransferase